MLKVTAYKYTAVGLSGRWSMLQLPHDESNGERVSKMYRKDD